MELTCSIENNTVRSVCPGGELNVPPRYVVKDIINSHSLPLIPIPIIDLSLLSLSTKEGLNELQKLKEALSSWGCFQLTGHEIANSFLDELREVTKTFFALPNEEKEKYARAEYDIEGFGTDPILSEKQVLDWSSRLLLKLNPVNIRNYSLWPHNPCEFRGLLHEYSEKMKGTIHTLLKAMARSLNLEENCFLRLHGSENEHIMTARFNYYPVCPRPNKVLGVKAHSDGSALTILLQGTDVEGLQVLNDGHWYRVPIIPHAFVVNLGDQMQLMSNGIFKSPVHRASVNSGKERISVAMFYMPNPSLEIGPVKELITEAWPPQYKRVKNYSTINFACFQRGENALESVRV